MQSKVMRASHPHVAAGTQVVLKGDVRGTNDSPMHPRGAVGIVARTPSGSEELYLIRFPDGFESSFSYEQFEILKHFKDHFLRHGFSAAMCTNLADFPAAGHVKIHRHWFSFPGAMKVQTFPITGS